MGLKKLSKRNILIFTIVGLVVLVSVIFNLVRYSQEEARQIADRNGEDNKQLAHITREMIEEIGEDYRSIRKKVLSMDTKSSGVKGHFESRDNKTSEITIGKLSGIYVANAYLGDGQIITYEIESAVKSGNFNIFICDDNHKIIHEIPIDQAAKISFLAEENKVYYVKFVAESAEISVKLTRGHPGT